MLKLIPSKPGAFLDTIDVPANYIETVPGHFEAEIGISNYKEYNSFETLSIPQVYRIWIIRVIGLYVVANCAKYTRRLGNLVDIFAQKLFDIAYEMGAFWVDSDNENG